MSPYLADGSVNVALVIALATALVQMIKPGIDWCFGPKVAMDIHDMVMRLVVLAFSLAGCVVLMNYGPIGLKTGADYVFLVMQVLTSTLGAFGLYRLVTGSVPATPTESYVAKIQNVKVAQSSRSTGG